MGLIDKIGGKGLVAGAMLGAGVLCSGCMSDYGNSFGRSLVETGMRQAVVSGVQNEVEGPRGTTVNVGGVQRTMMVNTERGLMSVEEIRRTPRVVCRGDVDGDGDLEWVYHDGRGNVYQADRIFTDGSGDWRFGKIGNFNQDAGFVYDIPGKPGCPAVPGNALRIWYADPALGID